MRKGGDLFDSFMFRTMTSKTIIDTLLIFKITFNILCGAWQEYIKCWRVDLI